MHVAYSKESVNYYFSPKKDRPSLGIFFRNDGLIFSISIPLYVLICPALLQLRTHLRVELTMQRISLQHDEAEDAHGE